MRILFVGELSSIHTVRWINQFKDSDWDIHIFQPIVRKTQINPELRAGTVYLPFLEGVSIPSGVSVERTLPPNPLAVISDVSLSSHTGLQWLQVLYLVNLIERLQPEVIHSLGLNVFWTNICLPVLRARVFLGRDFNIPWVYSSWGADLVHYANMSVQNRMEVESVLSEVDYYISECQRDLRLAREIGFKGEFLGYLPAFGGLNWDHFYSFRKLGPVSKRKTIILKGRDQKDGDPQGRALTALKAFALCIDEL